MGIYDREYYRDDGPGENQPGIQFRMPRTAVGLLILINVAVYLIAQLFVQHKGIVDPVADTFGAHVGTIIQPWFWWQFLTYGFVHAPDPTHVLFNMLGLWFLGRNVEQRYGTREFLWFYLVAIAAGGIIWSSVNKFLGLPNQAGPLIGASGAVSGVVILFAFNFPRQTLYLFGVIPMPAWLVGVFLVGSDALGALHGPGGSHIAYSVHLAGAALAGVYFWQGWNFSQFGNQRFWRQRIGPRSGLKIHMPLENDENDSVSGEDLARQVDQILEKIHREGEASLSRGERRILESASREYQRRRRP